MPPLPGGALSRGGCEPGAAADLGGDREVSARHLYLHLPFCERRCPYCDFAVVVGCGADPADFLAALEREVGLLGEAGIGVEPALTLYLGGGTPSWLGAGELERLLAWIGRTWGREWREATCEMNPEHADPERLAVLRAGAIGRLSLGVQSFTAVTLRRLGRVHTPGQAGEAIGRAGAAGFAVALDLIFGVPEQELETWLGDVARAAALEPDHISLYGLTWEPGTLFSRWRESGKLREKDEAWLVEAYGEAVEILRAAGYGRYEVSNFARPGAEAVHNRAYWTHAPYLGLGPSAHSLLGGVRIANERDLRRWQSLIGAGRLPWADIEVLDDLARTRERILLGLRTAAGLNLEDVPASYRDAITARTEDVVEAGHARRSGSRIILTDSGMLLADELAARLAP